MYENVLPDEVHHAVEIACTQKAVEYLKKKAVIDPKAYVVKVPGLVGPVCGAVCIEYNNMMFILTLNDLLKMDRQTLGCVDGDKMLFKHSHFVITEDVQQQVHNMQMAMMDDLDEQQGILSITPSPSAAMASHEVNSEDDEEHETPVKPKRKRRAPRGGKRNKSTAAADADQQENTSMNTPTPCCPVIGKVPATSAILPSAQPTNANSTHTDLLAVACNNC